MEPSDGSQMGSERSDSEKEESGSERSDSEKEESAWRLLATIQAESRNVSDVERDFWIAICTQVIPQNVETPPPPLHRLQLLSRCRPPPLLQRRLLQHRHCLTLHLRFYHLSRSNHLPQGHQRSDHFLGTSSVSVPSLSPTSAARALEHSRRGSSFRVEYQRCLASALCLARNFMLWTSVGICGGWSRLLITVCIGWE